MINGVVAEFIAIPDAMETFKSDVLSNVSIGTIKFRNITLLIY